MGMTAVTALLLSMLSLNAGLEAQSGAGDLGRAMILGNGPENEYESSLSRDQAALVMDAPGIRKDKDGTFLAEGEILVSAPAMRKTGVPTYLTINGFGPKGSALRPEIKIVSGRRIRAGAREVIVGEAAQDQLAGMQPGDKVILPNGAWPVVGVFSSGGDLLEGQLIADRDTLMNSVKLDDFNIEIEKLERLDAIGRFKAALAANPTLQVMAERETDYRDHDSANDRALVSDVAYGTGGIMALGAMFGALNIMVGAVRARRQEIGTLRALGFSGLPVAISVVSECLLLALDRSADRISHRVGDVQWIAENLLWRRRQSQGDSGIDQPGARMGAADCVTRESIARHQGGTLADCGCVARHISVAAIFTERVARAPARACPCPPSRC